MFSNRKIINRIKNRGRGWLFCPKYFYDVASRAVVDNTLSKLANDGFIIRLDRGIYFYPSYNKYVGLTFPNADKIAKVYADSIEMNILPCGARAANMLGFSMQVPATNSYICDKKAKNKKYGNLNIYFRKSYIAELKGIPFKLSLIITALNYLGKNSIDERIIKKCASLLDHTDKKSLLKVSNSLSYWLSEIVRKITVL
jgi:hypothetical protein